MQTIQTPHPEKLEFLKKDLTTKISDSTEDLFKMSNQWTWWYSIRSQSILKVLHQSRALLYAKYHFLKEEFDSCAVHYANLSKKFMRLTSIDGEDKILAIEEQKQQIEARTEFHRSLTERQEDYIAGNEARTNMLVSDARLNVNEAEYLKTNHYLDAVRDSATEIKNYPTKPELNFEDINLSVTQVTQKSTESVDLVDKITPSDQVKSFEVKQVIYSQVGSAPEFYVVEEQLEECLESAGENYVSRFSHPTIQNVNQLTLSTTCKEVFKQIVYKQNILSHIDFLKIVWASVVYIIALAGEILIFSAIFGLVFNFSEIKSIITGTAPALISFVLGFSLYGTILNFINKNNQIATRIIKSSRFMLLAIVLGLLYAFCIGLLYKNSLDEDELRSQMATQTQELYSYDPDILDEDMSEEERNRTIRENGNKIDETKTKLVKLQEGPMATITKLTIAFSSLIFLLFSGIMFGVLLLFLSAYKTNKAMKTIENRLPRIEAEFYSQRNVISEVDTLSNRILKWVGQKRFVEKLLAGDSTKDILFNQIPREKIVSFSPNGKLHTENVNTNL